LLPLGFASQNPSKGSINHEMKNYKINSSHQSIIKFLYSRYSSKRSAADVVDVAAGVAQQM